MTILTISRQREHEHRDPGSTVSYTITVTNSGQAAYSGASFTDPLTGVLDDASYNGDATATAGSLLHQPGPDLDRQPGRRRGGDHHVSATVEQPRHRRQDPDQRHHLGRGG